VDIVLIDDEPIIHQALGPFLSRSGHQVHHAADGNEGLALVSECKPDFIISDIRMPGIDGLELLGKLRMRVPTTPVALITGHGDITTAIAALGNGAFAYLRKPVKLDELVAVIERIENRHKLEQTFIEQNNRISQSLSSTQQPAETAAIARDVDHANTALRDDLQKFELLWQQTEPALRRHLAQEDAIAILLESIPTIVQSLLRDSERIHQVVHQTPKAGENTPPSNQ
jgi:DNA-binding NtrC family response regulator